MEPLSDKSYKALRLLKEAGDSVPETQLPFSFSRVELLVRDGLVDERTLLPPDKERAYSRGLSCYAISAAGEDALTMYEQLREKKSERKAQEEDDRFQSAINRKKERHHDFLVAIVGAITGSLCTLLAEHFDSILSFVKSLIK